MLLPSILWTLLCGQEPFGRKEGIPESLSDYTTLDAADPVKFQVLPKATSNGGAPRATVNAWTLCNRPPASATYTGTSTSYANAPSWEPHDFTLSGKSYKLALYSATVVRGLGKQERKWVDKVSRARQLRFNMNAARYVRAAIFVQMSEAEFMKDPLRNEHRIAEFQTMNQDKDAVKALLEAAGKGAELRCAATSALSETTDGEAAFLAVPRDTVIDTAKFLYLYCPVDSSSSNADKLQLEVWHKKSTFCSLHLKSAVCRRPQQRSRLTWCTQQATETEHRFDCKTAAQAVQTVAYMLAAGVDHVVFYDRWAYFDKLLAPFIDAGQLTLVNWPPFYNATGRWSRYENGFGYGNPIRAASAEQMAAGLSWDDQQLLYHDQINVILNCAMHFGSASKYQMFSDIDELINVHPEATTWRPGQPWPHGSKPSSLPPARHSIGDWLDAQDTKYDTFSFCAGMHLAPKTHSAACVNVWDATDTAVALESQWRSPHCFKRGFTMDKYIVRSALATVLEPGIHTVSQTWQMHQRHHKFCAPSDSKCHGRPGLLVVPEGVVHFLHLKTSFTAQVGDDGGWSGLDSWNEGDGKQTKLVQDRSLSWARPMLEPYFESNIHYDPGTKRCEPGKPNGPAYSDMDHQRRKTRAEKLAFLKEMKMGRDFGQERCRPVKKDHWTRARDPFDACCDPHSGLGVEDVG